ncbi:aminoadipate-semialdehyde dehydrogenase-like protein, partial [Leptotrombidium deliense]
MEKQCHKFRWAFNTKLWNPRKHEFLYAFNCLQEEERERISRFVFRRDFKQALIGRLMMRKCVSTAFSLPSNGITFGRSEKGKPILDKDL